MLHFLALMMNPLRHTIFGGVTKWREDQSDLSKGRTKRKKKTQCYWYVQTEAEGLVNTEYKPNCELNDLEELKLKH